MSGGAAAPRLRRRRLEPDAPSHHIRRLRLEIGDGPGVGPDPLKEPPQRDLIPHVRVLRDLERVLQLVPEVRDAADGMTSRRVSAAGSALRRDLLELLDVHGAGVRVAPLDEALTHEP